MDFSPLAKNFGFHTSRTSHENPVVWNISVAVGWIPVIGGILHAYLAYNRKDPILMGRAVCELIGLGPLIMIVDLIVTISRFDNLDVSAPTMEAF